MKDHASEDTQATNKGYFFDLLITGLLYLYHQ
jgi:hypothetical protein